MTDQSIPRFPPPSGAPVDPAAKGATPDPTSHKSPHQEAPAAGAAQYAGPHTPPPSRIMPPPAQESILARAKRDDRAAIRTMFTQFLPEGEPILEAHYLGVLGLWGIGSHSFVAVTPTRIATIRTSLAGGVEYQDGLLEFTNASAVYQPSKVLLFVTAASVSLTSLVIGAVYGAVGAILLLLASLLLLPVTVRIHYRLHKSGILLWVREGMPLYAFIDRKHMRLANQLYRVAGNAREDRLRAVKAHRARI